MSEVVKLFKYFLKEDLGISYDDTWTLRSNLPYLPLVYNFFSSKSIISPFFKKKEKFSFLMISDTKYNCKNLLKFQEKQNCLGRYNKKGVLKLNIV